MSSSLEIFNSNINPISSTSTATTNDYVSCISLRNARSAKIALENESVQSNIFSEIKDKVVGKIK